MRGLINPILDAERFIKKIFYKFSLLQNTSLYFKSLQQHVNDHDINRSGIQRLISPKDKPSRISIVKLSPYGNIRRSTPLHIAVAAGDIVAVKQLISKNHDPDANDATGLSPMELAYFIGEDEIIKTLEPFSNKEKQHIELKQKDSYVFYDLEAHTDVRPQFRV